LPLALAGGIGMAVVGALHPAVSPHVAVAVGILVPLAWIDIRHGVVSDLILAAGFVIAVILEITIGPRSGISGFDLMTFGMSGGLIAEVTEFVLPGALCAVFAWFIRLAGYLVGRAPGMGMGDVKLMFVLGLLLGLEAAFILYLAICAAGLFAAGGMIAGKLSAGRRIPFVPFLLLAVLAYPALISLVSRWFV
jgi:leader peptidase (prepilin peptidase) / N-methyltransferase